MSAWFIGALAFAGVLLGLAWWAGPPKTAKRATAGAASSSSRMAVQQPMKPVVLARSARSAPAPAVAAKAVKPITGGAAKPLTDLSPKAQKPDAIASVVQQKHDLGRRRMQHQEELNSIQVAIGDCEAAIARKEEVTKNQAELDAMRERAAGVRRSLAVIRAAEQSL
jgi:hypothetical protein